MKIVINYSLLEACVCVPLLVNKTQRMRVLRQQHHKHTSRYSREWRRTDPKEKTSLNKVIFVFFAHKKYSRSFIIMVEPLMSHMGYFNDVLTTFLWRVRKLSDFISNLNYVPKMNEGLTGLE